MARTSKKSKTPSRVVRSLPAPESDEALRARPVSSMPDIQGAIEAARRGDFACTPLQLLGVILKTVLKKRITDEEIDRISATYYNTIQQWWE
ncbi:MAG TPA: hypothetical protein VI756_28145 [Blastocatellia bacterium]